MKNIYSYKTKIGSIYIGVEDDSVTNISTNINNAECVFIETPLHKQTIKEINDYLDGNLKNFTVKTKLTGTEFQKKVWQELLKIPYGKTLSYKQIACFIGSPNAARAVGNACNKNPLLFIVPCHRVVGSDNSLTGFAIGTDIKQLLLNIEK